MPSKMCFVVIVYTICLTQKKLNGKVGKALKLLITALKLIIRSTFLFIFFMKNVSEKYQQYVKNQPLTSNQSPSGFLH